MDETYSLNGIDFVWNTDKAKGNPTKHRGVTFQQAAQTFFDPFMKVVDASQNNEARDAVIGMDNDWSLLFVVHVQVENDHIRIISAREATRTEKRYYEN